MLPSISFHPNVSCERFRNSKASLSVISLTNRAYASILWLPTNYSSTCTWLYRYGLYRYSPYSGISLTRRVLLYVNTGNSLYSDIPLSFQNPLVVTGITRVPYLVDLPCHMPRVLKSLLLYSQIAGHKGPRLYL